MSSPSPPFVPDIDQRRRDTELAIAVFRTIFILIVLFSPRFLFTIGGSGPLLTTAIISAATYNLVLFLLHLRGLPFPRWLIVFADLILVTLAVYFGGPDWSHFSALYYPVVIVAGLWFGVKGALASALLASVLYVWAATVTVVPPGAQPIAVGAMALHVMFLIVTAGVVSVAAEAQSRERQALDRSRASLREHWQRIRIAQTVDAMIRPRRLAVAPGLDIAFRFRPAAQGASGDYYDVIRLGGRTWGVCIGDIRAKLELAAPYLPVFRSEFRAAARRHPSPAQVLTEMNHWVTAETEERVEPDAFISMSYAVIDLDAGMLTYANAGHEPPVLVPASGEQATTLEGTGIVLGVVPDTAYQERSLPLHSGDLLVLFTDGMVEVTDRRRRPLGRDGLLARIASAVASPSAEAIAGPVFEYVNEYGKRGLRRDDMTLLIVRVTAADLGGVAPSADEARA
jgi:sigma-B regulation protein RsbU (phosphoserine phosphatase)